MLGRSSEVKWKDKYRGLVDELERKEEQWVEVETLLRQSVSRVAIAATHLDTRLDKPLKTIRTAVNKKLNTRRLEDGLEDLSRTLEVVDRRSDVLRPWAALLDSLDPPTGMAANWQKVRRSVSELTQETVPESVSALLNEAFRAQTPDDTQQLGAALGSMISELPIERRAVKKLHRLLDGNAGLDAEPLLGALGEELGKLLQSGAEPGSDDELQALLIKLLNQVAECTGQSPLIDELREKLQTDLKGTEWLVVLEGTAQLISGVIGLLRGERAELSKLFDHVATQLEFFHAYVEASGEDVTTTTANREGMQQNLTASVDGIRETVLKDADIGRIRERIQSQLDGISEEIVRFTEQETERLEQVEERNETLTKRIHDLELESSTLQRRCEEQNAKLVLDPLTQVHSRYAYNDRVAEEFGRWQRHGKPLSFAIWDIDHFKAVNDQFGHKAGDLALQRLAQFVRSEMRDCDFLARIGGEEFVILFPDTACDEAFSAIDNIRTRVEQTKFNYEGKRVPLSISCGLTEFSTGDDPETVYERADQALYRAKSGGRNRCVEV